MYEVIGKKYNTLQYTNFRVVVMVFGIPKSISINVKLIQISNLRRNNVKIFPKVNFNQTF